MKDLVSVCIPVYNGERYLKESLECVLNQTYTNLEVLIVDDQSTDSSLKISREFAEDPRVRVVRNENNLGLVGNWNECLKLAKGSWVKLHFQDDLMQPNTIERMHDLAVSRKVDVVLTDREYFFENDKQGYFQFLQRLSDFYSSDTVITPEELLSVLLEIGIRMNFLGEPILGLIHKRVVERLGSYDHTLRHIVDFEYWLRLGLNLNIGFIPDRLNKFRVHDHSQGAKNVFEEKILPTHIDMMFIESKMKTHEQYSVFRSHQLYDQAIKMINTETRIEIKKYGYNRIKQIIGEEVMGTLELDFRTKFIGRINDYRKRNLYKG